MFFICYKMDVLQKLEADVELPAPLGNVPHLRETDKFSHEDTHEPNSQHLGQIKEVRGMMSDILAGVTPEELQRLRTRGHAGQPSVSASSVRATVDRTVGCGWSLVLLLVSRTACPAAPRQWPNAASHMRSVACASSCGSL